MIRRLLVVLPVSLCLGFSSSCKESAEPAPPPEVGSGGEESGGGEQVERSLIIPEQAGSEALTKLPRREEDRIADGRPAPKPEHPQAAWIPGKAGFVFNPYTNNPVDVRGLPPGTLCRDPADEDKTHLFRVPAAPEAAEETD